MSRPRRMSLLPAALALTMTAGLAAAAQDTPKLPAGFAAGTPQGYLPHVALPDSLALLPPPPPRGSAAFARDEEASKAALRPAGSPRFTQAASDADLNFAHLSNVFDCAAGISPDPKKTPVLFRLLQKSMIDVGLSTYKAKNHYQRTRPFVVHGQSTCFPKDDAMLRKDGSYPSGHSAIGWGWALILTGVNPERADAILQRGRDFGQSRVVCQAHWQSDVDAGRVVAAATVARLYADPVFRADVQAARNEIAEADKAGAKPSTQCAAEAAALAG
jgi:acid phosphatase (class A)